MHLVWLKSNLNFDYHINQFCKKAWHLVDSAANFCDIQVVQLSYGMYVILWELGPGDKQIHEHTISLPLANLRSFWLKIVLLAYTEKSLNPEGIQTTKIELFVK